MAKNRGRKPPAAVAKKPAIGVVPPGGKHPQIAPAVDGADAFMTWRFSKVDLGGDWPWSWEAFERYQPQLVCFEAKTWEESTTKGSIGVTRIPTEHLPEKAFGRLRKLKLDDFDLHEIRVTKKSRFWGFRLGHCFHFVWWDPNHKVFPRK